jgi:hypothetical protein
MRGRRAVAPSSDCCHLRRHPSASGSSWPSSLGLPLASRQSRHGYEATATSQSQSSSPSNVLIPTKNLDGMTHGNDTMTLST